MITGRWGKPSEVLLDIVADPDGSVRGVMNPGRQDVPIRTGSFDPSTGAVQLAGDHVAPDGTATAFHAHGRLDGRTLRLSYSIGDDNGTVELVRVEEYRPPRRTLRDRVEQRIIPLLRALNALRRRRQRNRLRRSAGDVDPDSIIFRDAVTADIPALAELHVTTWNATYRTTRGPTIATRTHQWNTAFAKKNRRDFVLVLEDREGRLVGFTWGKPHTGEFAGELSKIYLRWEYHGLGLGRRLLAESARRFLDRGIDSFILFADAANPTVGFFDHMGGERLLDEHGEFRGAFGWRELSGLEAPRRR